MGDLGVSNLYGQYADYQSFGMDFGYRRYVPVEGSIRTYAEATIGLAFIDETDVVLTAPGGNFTGTATDFYDRTSAFTMGFNVGVLFGVMSKADVFTQIGLRYVTGMSDVDQLAATGLETINDKSSRWAMPFVFRREVSVLTHCHEDITLPHKRHPFAQQHSIPCGGC